MQFKKTFLLLSVIFFYNTTFSQESKNFKENIGKNIEEYFLLDRENIHIQLNKNIFLNNETVWFKGYVYNRKQKLPFISTTNVYATLYDENGIKIYDKLLFSKLGSFSGKLELGENFKSGSYHLRVFTNWMNNFKEDESASFEFHVINKNDKTSIKNDKINFSKTTVEFYPEGGSIVEGVQNSIGIKLSDCYGKPLPVSEVDLVDLDNQLVQKIAINKFGLGKFQFLATKNLKISYTINSQKNEKNLPAYSQNGLALEVNNYSFKEKTIAKIRINQRNLEAYKAKKIYMVVHQDEKFNIYDIDFLNNNLEQTVLFSNENLFEGINYIRIIDENKKQFAERSIFLYPNNFLKADISTVKNLNDTIVLKGKINLPNTNFSISILPEKTLNSNKNHSLLSSFLISPYVTEKISDSNYYFEDVSRLKQYAIDLFLLNQSSTKYKWENIISTPPTNTFPFDYGISLKGTLNQTLKDRKRYRVNLFSIKAELNESAEINEKNEFFFNNLILADSTWVNFTLVDDKKQSSELKLYPQILNGRRNFNKPFTVSKLECSTFNETEYELPSFIDGSITLDQVEINSEQKKTLSRSKSLGNGNLRGYKVDENDNKDVLDYIRNNGFDVPFNTNSLTVQIFGRSVTTINGARNSPVLYIDDQQQMNFDLLLNMRMNEIDEIYINPNAIVASVNNNQGIIKIYRRLNSANNTKNNAKSFEIKNAFSKIENFKNNSYVSTDTKGFQNFGIINWIPSILTQDNGEFKFAIPDLKQKKVKLLIEGFSADGKLLSEIRTIDLQ